MYAQTKTLDTLLGAIVDDLLRMQSEGISESQPGLYVHFSCSQDWPFI